MLSLHLTAFSLALLVLQAIGFPAPAPVSLLPRADDETWGIPSMQLHMMTRLSGLPGDGVWPSESKFPSSIDFAVDMPGQSFTCHTTFANGTLPEDLAACSGEGDRVGFRMLPYTASGSRRPETSFVLQVFRVKRDGGHQTMTAGEVAITANEPTQPTSYLSCLLGAPFDGLRCNLRYPGSNYNLPEIVARNPPSADMLWDPPPWQNFPPHGDSMGP